MVDDDLEVAVGTALGYESLPLKLHAQPMVGRRDGRASVVECKPHPVFERKTGMARPDPPRGKSRGRAAAETQVAG